MRTRPIAAILVIACLVIAAAVALVLLDVVALPWAGPSGSGPVGPSEGRLRVEYELLSAGDIAPGAGDREVVAEIIRHRLETAGLTDAAVKVEGDRIVVDVPSIESAPVLRRLVLPSGRLDFVPLGNDAVLEGAVLDLRTQQPLFSGDQVASASVGNDQQGLPTVDFVLRPEAAALFASYTADHIGEYFAITLDGRVLKAPVIRGAIKGGEVQIAMGQPAATLDQVRELVSILRFGSFPWPLREVGTEAAPT